MKFSIIDLEWTSWKNSLERNYSFEWEFQEIIQIGTIKFFSNEKGFKSKNILVKPNKNKILSNYIQRLTGITQREIMDYGMNFKDASKILEIFFLDVDIILCNGLDKEILKKNYIMNNLLPKNFVKKIFNIRPFISKKLKIDETKIVSGELNEKINMKSLKKHDALMDCINIYNFLYKYNYFNIK